MHDPLADGAIEPINYTLDGINTNGGQAAQDNIGTQELSYLPANEPLVSATRNHGMDEILNGHYD